jgi:hypothetical protein
VANCRVGGFAADRIGRDDGVNTAAAPKIRPASPEPFSRMLAIIAPSSIAPAATESLLRKPNSAAMLGTAVAEISGAPRRCDFAFPSVHAVEVTRCSPHVRRSLHHSTPVGVIWQV